MTVKDLSAGSGDLSEANRELRQRVSELEWQVSKQKACIRDQRSQLRQQQKRRDLQDDTEKAEVMLLHPAHSNNKDVEEAGLRSREKQFSYETRLMMIQCG